MHRKGVKCEKNIKSVVWPRERVFYPWRLAEGAGKTDRLFFVANGCNGAAWTAPKANLIRAGGTASVRGGGERHFSCPKNGIVF